MKSGMGALSAGTMGRGGPGPRALGGPLLAERGDRPRLTLPCGVPVWRGGPGRGGPGPRAPVGVPGCDGPNDRGVPLFGVPPASGVPGVGVPMEGPGLLPMEPGRSVGAIRCFASSMVIGSGKAWIS